MHGEGCSGSQKHNSRLAICWKQHVIIVPFSGELISFSCLAAFNKRLVYLSWPLGERRGRKCGPCGSIVLQRNYQLDLFKCKPNVDQLEMNIKSLHLQYKQFTLYFTEIIQLHKFGEVDGTHTEVVFKYFKLKTKCLLDNIYS